jgi:hypothetical protein
MADFKLLPYGLSDFRQIVKEGKYIVDKIRMSIKISVQSY